MSTVRGVISSRRECATRLVIGCSLICPQVALHYREVRAPSRGGPSVRICLALNCCRARAWRWKPRHNRRSDGASPRWISARSRALSRYWRKAYRLGLLRRDSRNLRIRFGDMHPEAIQKLGILPRCRIFRGQQHIAHENRVRARHKAQRLRLIAKTGSTC